MERTVWIEAAFGGFVVKVQDGDSGAWVYFTGDDFGEALQAASGAMGGVVAIPLGRVE